MASQACKSAYDFPRKSVLGIPCCPLRASLQLYAAKEAMAEVRGTHIWAHKGMQDVLFCTLRASARAGAGQVATMEDIISS